MDHKSFENTLRSLVKAFIFFKVPIKGGGRDRHKNPVLTKRVTGLVADSALTPFYMEYSAKMFFSRLSTISMVQFAKIHFISLQENICHLK